MRRCIYCCVLCEASKGRSRPFYSLAAVWRHSARLHGRREEARDLP